MDDRIIRVCMWWALLHFICGSSPIHAHIGDKIYPIFEIQDGDLGKIDLYDGALRDWENIVGISSLQISNFYLDPTVGGEGPYSPEDLAWTVWLGWNRSHTRLYAAVNRSDDRYVNEYLGDDPTQMWRNDAIEFKVDGDHSGGEYGYTANCCETEDAWRRINNAHAQHYTAIIESPDHRPLVNGGGLPGPQWAVSPPYAEAGGRLLGADQTQSTLEFFVTPFDRLVWDSPEQSTMSALFPGKVIGFEFNIVDFDAWGLDQEEPTFTNYYSLSDQPATWRYAERFVDGRLMKSPGPTVVEEISWARIKAAIKRRVGNRSTD